MMSDQPRKIRVGVIFGGRSAEHEISLASARSIMSALDKDKYEVVQIGITRDGRWIASGDPMRALASGDAADSGPAALLGDPSQRGLIRLETPARGVEAFRGVKLSELDVIFPVLHGPYGEDGTVQGLLDLADLPYVGCGVTASAVGMDKAVMKDVFRAHGLPVVDYLVVKRKDWEADPEDVIAQAEARLAYPMFVKPANLGSSVGVSKAHDRAGLRTGLDLAARYDRKLLVERGIDAREIEVSVLGNDDPIASIPGEIIPSREFYSYEAKYLDDASELLIPAPIPAESAEHARRMAIEAYRALDCAGMARVDFLMDRHTGVLWLGEVNTIPGFTKISMYPKLWEASGIPYPELVERLIDLALERHADKARSRTTRE
jgi:D-alanine-D-alanine ligase